MRIKRKLYSTQQPPQIDPTKQQRIALQQQHQAIQQNKLSISQINALTNTQKAANQPVRNQLQAQRNGIEAVKASKNRSLLSRLNRKQEEGKYTKPNYSEGKPKRVVSME
jgi:hypothetical protein